MGEGQDTAGQFLQFPASPHSVVLLTIEPNAQSIADLSDRPHRHADAVLAADVSVGAAIGKAFGQ